MQYLTCNKKAIPTLSKFLDAIEEVHNIFSEIQIFINFFLEIIKPIKTDLQAYRQPESQTTKQNVSGPFHKMVNFLKTKMLPLVLFAVFGTIIERMDN